MYVDSTANQRGSEVGLVLISPERATIEKSLRLGLLAMNNEAEYKTLLQGMGMVQKIGGKVVEMFSDSRLVVGQVKGEIGQRCENARVPQPGQMPTAKFRPIQLVTLL